MTAPPQGLVFRLCLNIVQNFEHADNRCDAVARVAPDANPNSWRTPCTSRPSNGTPGILAADYDNHRWYRHLLANAFLDRGMRAQQRTTQSHVEMLIRRLRER
jgi:averantin hydroxylase